MTPRPLDDEVVAERLRLLLLPMVAAAVPRTRDAYRRYVRAVARFLEGTAGVRE